MNIDLRLRRVFSNLFSIEPDRIHNKLSAADVDRWDSLQHLNLVIAIEEEFAITIDAEQITEMLTYELIALLITEKLAALGK